MNEELITKFPKLFRQALEGNRIKLPNNVKDTYENIQAYRALTIIKGQPPLITKEAFASQMELKALYPNNRNFKDYDENNIENYSCSLYTTVNALANAMHLPRPTKVVMCGLVTCQNGIMNYKEHDKHINWWLYENHTAVEDFEVIDYEKK